VIIFGHFPPPLPKGFGILRWKKKEIRLKQESLLLKELSRNFFFGLLPNTPKIILHVLFSIQAQTAMAGGLMQLVSVSGASLILYGNPTKTFFKANYKKTTNFAMQKFFLNYEGNPNLSTSDEATYSFKVKRYADLLMDCFFVINTPHIWSGLMPPSSPVITAADQVGGIASAAGVSAPDNGGVWVPYEFRWIKYLGVEIISEISVICGNTTIQKFPGDYILQSVERDYSFEKKQLFYEMIGHVPEMIDPGNGASRLNAYPNAYYQGATQQFQPEPSIRARTLYVPLHLWFSQNTHSALPLTSLQYNEVTIQVKLRPIQQWFQIRDIADVANNFPLVCPNFHNAFMLMHRFLQPPPSIAMLPADFVETRNVWNPNVHLMCTYCFLSNDEARLFALNEQTYLIKQPFTYTFHNICGATKLTLPSSGLVSSFLFTLRRSDVNLRNEWTNFSNFPYESIPIDLQEALTVGQFPIYRYDTETNPVLHQIGPGVNADGRMTGLWISPIQNVDNIKTILVSMGILFDGDYRENVLPVGVYDYTEKWQRTGGNSGEGRYVYAFCLQTPTQILQPTGAVNMTKYNRIELEVVTIIPPVNPYAQTLTICDPLSGNILGINKPTWQIYMYTFDMTLYEERYNVLSFMGGNCGLLYAM